MLISWLMLDRKRKSMAAAGMVVLISGCFSPKPPASENTVASAGGEVTAEEATPRETLNKKTQNVLKLDDALASGGVRDRGEVSSTNPLMQTADVYRTQVAKLGGMAVQQAIQLRNAQSIQDPKPLTHAQFMTDIIKPGQPDGIQLPMLPYYQEYAWDEATQELVAVNFPARIDAREKQR
ncbi:MAG TPA: hypothetical protein DDZ51_24735 [Planctomycetaceae bacterium]|nr:hypothetical protein [Planctomycetaceae bacterium]